MSEHVPGPVKIAAVQMEPRLGAGAENRRRLITWTHAAADAGARLIVFPECALTGYVLETRAEAAELSETIPGPSTEELAALCEARGVYALFGLIERTGARLHNAAALLGPQRFQARYRKIHLPAMGVDRYLDPGAEPLRVFDLPELDLRLGIQICYDGAFPEPARVQTLQGADLIVLPTNWPTGAELLAEHLMPCRAIENVVYTAAVNRVGQERGVTFIGRSAIHDPFGRPLAQAAATGEELLLADIDPARARSKRIVRVPGSMELDRIADRRPAFYGPITGHGNSAAGIDSARSSQLQWFNVSKFNVQGFNG